MDVEELSDRAEIADALHRYTIAVDTGEWDRLDSVFTRDARIDYTESGGIAGPIGEVKPWLAENLPAFSKARMHTLGQIVIAFATPRDEAKVTAYFHNPMVVADPTAPGGSKVVEVGGLYHHSFVRTTRGWRSRRLHEQLVWSKGF